MSGRPDDDNNNNNDDNETTGTYFPFGEKCQRENKSCTQDFLAGR